MASVPVPSLSPEEYFKLDDASERPLEYIDGEVFEIEAATGNHSLVVANLIAAAVTRLNQTPCAVYAQGMRVRVKPTKYLQPDLAIICGKLESGPDGNALNPTVIFEVLSDSTAGYDLARKGLLYRSIPTLKEYVVISQSEPWVQKWSRHPESWDWAEFVGLDVAIRLGSVNIEIPLREIYNRVEIS